MLKRRSFLGLVAGAAVTSTSADAKERRTAASQGLRLVEGKNGSKMLFEDFRCEGRTDGVTRVSVYLGHVKAL